MKWLFQTDTTHVYTVVYLWSVPRLSCGMRGVETYLQGWWTLCKVHRSSMAQEGSFREIVRRREKGGVGVSEWGGTEIAGTLFYRVCTQQWLMWPGQGMELDGARVEITKFIWRYFHTAAGQWPKVLSLRGNWGDWPCFIPAGQTQSKRQVRVTPSMV